MNFDMSEALNEIEQLPLSFTDRANTRYQHRGNDRSRSLHTIVDSNNGAEVWFRSAKSIEETYRRLKGKELLPTSS